MAVSVLAAYRPVTAGLLISACTISALSVPVTINIRRPAPKATPSSTPNQHRDEDGSPLIIVGAGALGCRVASLWKALEGDRAPVYAVTRRPDNERDASLRAKGIIPCLKGDRSSALPSQCKHIVFCAPPGRSFNAASLLLYPGVISSALGLWESDAANASFVFTSSAGVYAEVSGGVVVEHSCLAETLRAERLLAAESLVTGCGGSVIRLAGLYDRGLGAHTIFLARSEWPADPDGLINQVID